jgi:hypothetical protein
MSRNGSGIYSLPQPPFVPNTTISSAAVNSDLSDIAAALTQSVSADGQTPITGALKSSVTTTPGFSSTLDGTTGFGVSVAGEADVWAGGVKVITATASEVSINANIALSALTIESTQTGVSVSVTSATPGVVTWTAHAFSANQPVFFTAASMPGGLTSEQTYFVVGASITTNTFEVSSAPNGSAINTTSTGTTVLGWTPALNVVGGANVEDGLTADQIICSSLTCTGTASISGLFLPTPQGRLTVASNTPVINGDVVSATVIYYTPFTGAWVPLNNGSTFAAYNFSQLSLTLTASQGANGIYDIFLAYNSGAPVIGTGPSWLAGGGSVTAGSCARGSGSGSTALSRSTGGIWVNTVSMSLIYNTGSGNTTITVPAGQGVYLGSIYIDGTAGQVSCYASWGQSRKFGVWNAYNRVPVILQAGDSTSSSWTYSTATIRPSNNNTANSLITFAGLPEEWINLIFTQVVNNTTTVGVGNPSQQIGIGWNSITAFSGIFGGVPPIENASILVTAQASFYVAPVLGVNVATSLEKADGGGIDTWKSGSSQMNLSATWRN